MLFTSRPPTTDWFGVTIYSDSYSAAYPSKGKAALECRARHGARESCPGRTKRGGRDAGIVDTVED